MCWYNMCAGVRICRIYGFKHMIVCGFAGYADSNNMIVCGFAGYADEKHIMCGFAEFSDE